MADDDRVFSRQWRRKYGDHGLGQGLVILVCCLASLALGVVLAAAVVPGGLRGTTTLSILREGWVYLLLPGACVALVVHFMRPRWRERELREAVRAKVRDRDGVDPDEWGAQFVSWWPGRWVHVWERDTACDVGFLFVGPSYITYLGDWTSFSLRREAVQDLGLGGSGGRSSSPWLAGSVSVGYWGARGETAFLGLSDREKRPPLAPCAGNRRMRGLLQEWWQGTAQLAREQPVVPAGPPEIEVELAPRWTASEIGAIVIVCGAWALALLGALPFGPWLAGLSGGVAGWLAARVLGGGPRRARLPRREGEGDTGSQTDEREALSPSP